jgi:hypothetical protein
VGDRKNCAFAMPFKISRMKSSHNTDNSRWIFTQKYDVHDDASELNQDIAEGASRGAERASTQN